MMEERYHATTQNRFYPDMSNINKNITVLAEDCKHLCVQVNITGLAEDCKHQCVQGEV